MDSQAPAQPAPSVKAQQDGAPPPPSAPSLLRSPPVPDVSVVGDNERGREDEKHERGGQHHGGDRSPRDLEPALLVLAFTVPHTAHDLGDDHGQSERSENESNDH
jgi:hypothetical protein